MKFGISLTAFLLFFTIVNAQTGTISGIVVDGNNEPLMGVNLMVLNTAIGGQTDSDGSFSITGIPTDNNVLKLSYLGFRSREINITIVSGANENLGTIVLYEGNEVLNEVVVQGERRNKFSRKETAYVSKLPLKDIENTQVYSTVTTELLESQVVVNFDDALKNATGVENLWASTGRGGDGAGYYALRGFSVQPQLVNGLPGLTNGTINPANIERIEVIKGPSATLFGNAVSSYGGLINVVTKKPYIGSGGSLSFTSGSFGFNQIVGDFNTALDKDENLYFRLNSSYSTEQSFQDAGFRKSFFVAPSLSYRVNNRLSFSFYGEITQAEQTNPTFLFLNRTAPTEAQNLDELNYNNKLSFTSNELTLQNPTQNYRLEMDYKLSDAWQSQTLLSTSATSTSGYYTYLFEFGILGGDTFTRFVSKQNSNTNTIDVQQNFIGDFKVAGLRNRMVIGLDYLNVTTTDNSSGFVFYGNTTPEGVSSGDNPFTPDVIEEDTFPLSTAGVDAALENTAIGNNNSEYSIYSLYVSDVINFTPQLSIMLGLRLDRFDNDGDLLDEEDDFAQTALSPKVGIMYQPIANKLSVFANYQNGFNNVAPQLVGDPEAGAQTLQTFDPEQANQLEGGLKANFLGNRLNGTISYYDITVKNRVIQDPANPFNFIANGEIESRGVELELNANPIRGLNARGGYSYNDSETTRTDDPLILNKRPLEAGPRNLYNFWASYAFQFEKLKGFGLGFGFNGASERFVKNYTTTGNFTLPAYTVYNASAFYEADKYRITLKLNNATNLEYYTGWSTINPQQPRAVLANVTYRF
ncbi:TonB-dependent receptor [Flagellimonas sp. HMM57]|uniref:TonB-dependent receptor n=1 Tax=unclassified Flagellimonas TaxID=2644544 RepID=UPI0013CF544E|nr:MULTISPECIES: TonB-dependent receptor [unclassified Flagellimonas]UII77071.1 TonB-dependent receptor [Flagellimonas sp. HMM57]